MNNLTGVTHNFTGLSNNVNLIYSIGYKYNSRKVLIFIYTPRRVLYFTENSYNTWWCGHRVNVHFFSYPLYCFLFI